MSPARDSLTDDMFCVPVPVVETGALSIGHRIKALIARKIRESGLSRTFIAARMSELTGAEITKHQLDSWTADSREGWRFPLEYLPALEVALDTHDITAMIADLRGARLVVGRDALDAEIGRLERQRDEATRRIKALKGAVGVPE
ncbi:MAG: hypothetical protein FWD77_08385 [Betaproteobacteria bacterium]|nr:hypothetical protein [Betaproteobacteria bacterium]